MYCSSTPPVLSLLFLVSLRLARPRYGQDRYVVVLANQTRLEG